METNSIMPHVSGFDAKVRRNERLWLSLDIRNMFGQLLVSKFIIFSIQGIKLPIPFAILLISIFLHK